LNKNDVLELVHKQPEDVDLARLIYTLYIRRQIELGTLPPDTREAFSLEKFERLSNEWTVAGYPFSVTGSGYGEE
jgi:hypothetical protein